MTKRDPFLLFRVHVGDEILPSYMGIIMDHYKDPYSTTSIMESKRVFFSQAHHIFCVARSRSRRLVMLFLVWRIGCGFVEQKTRWWQLKYVRNVHPENCGKFPI